MSLAGSGQAIGHFRGKIHILPVRIYYEDTDLSGVVYHANYLRFMERGRSEFFRAAGIPLASLDKAEPTAWALRNVSLEFHKAARLDDVLEVHTACTAISGARMSAEQKIFANGSLLTRGTVEACIITLSGKPRRIPEFVRAKLAPFLVETNT